MTERFKLSLSGMWLLASLLSITLPVFVPSYGPPNLANPIGAATAAMFILSFPSSLFGLPFLFLVSFILRTDMNSIEGMYVNLLLLFVLGLVQWFWIVPRMFRTEPELLIVQIPGAGPNGQLSDFHDTVNRPISEIDDRTPLERVLRDGDVK